MKTIDKYIELSKKMKNTSRGGAPSYIFREDNVVLVEYSNLNEYGLARPMEEEVANSANKKNSEGVRTPKHIEIARVTEGERNYCYVLQELAQGRCMSDYKANYGDIEGNITGMKWTSEIPQEHIEKAIKDLMELYNMGLELKPKNFFYDQENGYTFIDLLGYGEKPEFNSLLEINTLCKYAQAMLSQYFVSKYDEGVTQQYINIFQNLKADVLNKMFKALSNVVPNFSQYRRYILRTLDKEILIKMFQKGYIQEDLSLTEKEIEEYNVMIANIVRKNLKSLEEGNTSYNNIMINEIRIEIEATGFKQSWFYHPECKKINVAGLDSYDKDYTREQILLNNVYKMFNQKVVELAQTSTNENIQNAYQEVLKKVNVNNGSDPILKM